MSELLTEQEADRFLRQALADGPHDSEALLRGAEELGNLKIDATLWKLWTQELVALRISDDGGELRWLDAEGRKT